MLEHLIRQYLPYIISILEVIGIFVVVVAALENFYHYLKELFSRSKVRNIKMDLALGMATGLEFKMAAEILKTVLVQDLNELLVLGSVILLRALLSFMIHYEMKNSKDIH